MVVNAAAAAATAQIVSMIPVTVATGMTVQATKGIPKMDGSGKGRRANRGRGGCEITEKEGKGRRIRFI